MIEITMPVPLPRRQRRALKFLKLFGAACVLFAGYKLLEIGVFALAGDPLVAWEEKVLHASALVYGFFTVIAWKMRKMYGWVNVFFFLTLTIFPLYALSHYELRWLAYATSALAGMCVIIVSLGILLSIWERRA